VEGGGGGEGEGVGGVEKEINPVLRLLSLVEFARFAELTVHESVLVNTLNSDEHVRQLFVNYISQVCVY